MDGQQIQFNKVTIPYTVHTHSLYLLCLTQIALWSEVCVTEAHHQQVGQSANNRHPENENLDNNYNFKFNLRPITLMTVYRQLVDR